MFAQTYSATQNGIDGEVIKIESARQRALPKIIVTGLPGDVIRESRERVKAALFSLGFDVPSSQILVHLSPASAKKQGSQFDLGIALSVLAAEQQLKGSLSQVAFLGELSLEGKVIGIRGAISLIEALKSCAEIKTILISRENEHEASLVGGDKVRLVGHLSDAIEFLEGKRDLPLPQWVENKPKNKVPSHSLDHVLGQSFGKRALQIALAGRHHLLFLGPPGVGKSMIARCSSSLLPDLDRQESIEVIKSYEAAGVYRKWDYFAPFRSPHHSISAAGMLGGGTQGIVPGEVTLSHNGVLFVDEFAEFRRDVIEGMREPLQSGEIHLHRIGHYYKMPARFILIAAMNPCPCGHSLGASRRCLCPWEKIHAYRRRVSGAILERIDLGVILMKPSSSELNKESLSHDEVKLSIERARSTQYNRYKEGILNADESAEISHPDFELSEEINKYITVLKTTNELSFRTLTKLIRAARTIADLEGELKIKTPHIKEAWSFRCPDWHHLNS